VDKAKVKTMLWDKTQGHCWYCGCKLNLNPKITKYTATIEHQTPLSIGGTDAIENLALACFSCNSIKRSKTLSEFRLMLTCQKIQGGDLWAYYRCLQTAIDLAPNSHKPNLQICLDKIEGYVTAHQHVFYGEYIHAQRQEAS
jgi:hypothetical protein